MMIRQVGEELLDHYATAKVLDAFDVFDVLMNYWNALLQDDIYIIKASGYQAGREVEYTYKQKTDSGQNAETGEVESFEGVLIPVTLIEAEYHPEEQEHLANLNRAIRDIEAELEALVEEQPEEDDSFSKVLGNSGKISEKELNARLKALDEKRTSAQLDVLDELLENLAEKKHTRISSLLEQHPQIAELDLYGKKGNPTKTKLTAVRKELASSAPVPAAYQDEYETLTEYRDKLKQNKALKKQAKEARDELDQKVLARYGKLTEDEIKRLLFDRKWLAHLASEIEGLFDQQVNAYAKRITDIARRYERTLPDIEDAVQTSREKVMRSLERMGYKW